VHPSTVEAFCKRFGPVGFKPEAMFATYGIAENTLATACPGPGAGYSTQALRGGAPVSSLGGPLAGQELAVVDEQNQIVAEGVEGEVVVRGACVMKGYFNDEAATRRAIDAQGWLHTGDWGFVEKGSLALTGRKKDMVIKMGRNYYPSDVEGLLGSFAKIKGPAVAFASPNLVEGTEDLILLIENEPLSPEAHKQLVIEINAELLARLGIRADKVVCLAPGSLAASRESAERARLRAAFLEGKLA
jgi:fatty-acyl-CoA synthase